MLELRKKGGTVLGTYQIPRNVKGESRVLFIFSMKALIYTSAGAAAGLVLYFILNLMGMFWPGIIVLLIFALIGFAIGTFKIPETDGFEFTRKTGGENIDDVIKRAALFKMKKKKIYVYTREEKE